MKTKNTEIVFLIICISVFYVFFPTQNSTLDAFGYAAQIKYSKDLFLPHHLLYNAFYYVLIYPVKAIFPQVEVLMICKIFNSLFVIINLIVLSKILDILNFKRLEIILLLIFAGFSYNIWRFGTENEVYILPITFSLVGSYFFLKFIKINNLKHLFFAGFFTALACLFHQNHFFWWLGTLLGVFLWKRNFRTIFVYSISAILVLITYVIVLFFYSHEIPNFTSFLHFVFHDFYTGSAKTEFGSKNIIMFFISSVRTFLQIHPNILFLIKKNLLFAIPILILLFVFFEILLSIYHKNLFKRRLDVDKIFFETHVIILVLNLLFACYAVGNVEFMVMIPFLIVLTIFYFYEINLSVLKNSAIVFFLWNFFYGIAPNNLYHYTNEGKLVEFAIKNPKIIFIVEDNLANNIYFYKTGIDGYKNIIKIDQITSENQLKNRRVFTNIIDKPSVFNRAKLMKENNNAIDLKKHQHHTIYTSTTLYGDVKISEVFVK